MVSLMQFVVFLICILISQQVDSFVTEDMGSIGNAIGSLKDELLKLHLELNSVKDKLDHTVKDNIILKNRVDIISKENRGIKRAIKYKEYIRCKSASTDDYKLKGFQQHFHSHPSYNSSHVDSQRSHAGHDIPIEYADTAANTTISTQQETTTTKPPVITTTSTTPPAITTTPQPPPIITEATIRSTQPPMTRVAFSVGLTKTIPLDFLQAIPYDMAYMNIGDGYQRSQKSFIVPVSGVYVLYFSALNTSGIKAYIEMVQNGRRLAIVNLGGNDYNMGSQIVMTYLSKGHAIWVRNASGAGPTVKGNAHETYNTFSGLLLY